MSVAAGRIRDIPGIFQKVRSSLHRHCQVCQTTSGRNFEHVLQQLFNKRFSVPSMCCSFCSFPLLLCIIDPNYGICGPELLCDFESSLYPYTPYKFVGLVANHHVKKYYLAKKKGKIFRSFRFFICRFPYIKYAND
ncbi:hypothetical protein TNCV_4771301 [Trichonephila clavipes]|nr:hypothetical protein TNCV_4771301 [Trichonephila clavipes]